jgi:hypothetical protein
MAHDHLVHEAFGPALSPRAATGAIGLGVVALLFAGVIPVLLGGMADEGRISDAGIGYCAGLEGLSMGIVTALAGILLKSRNLRWLGAGASIALVAINLATTQMSGGGVFAMRIAAGVPEGLLLWLTVSMIARTEVPERWAGVFFTALVGGQLALALALWGFVMNRWGANGGFAALALATAPGIVFAFLAPDRYAPLPKPEGESGSPPLRGWVALLGTLFFAGAAGAVGTFLQPLAHEAGLSADVARTALWVSLVAQVAGGATATALGGRVHYMSVFVFTTLCFLAAFAVFGFGVPAWLFVAANTLAGFVTILLGPYLVPMTIEADPSRRAAVLSASTQVLAGAIAPFCAAVLVHGSNVRGVLYFGGAILLVGLAVFAALHLFSARERAAAAGG